MKIYFDVCCLCRPFDDQNIDRNHMEAQALSRIKAHILNGEWIWISSEVVDFEINQISDNDLLEAVSCEAAQSDEYVFNDQNNIQRARTIKDYGFDPFDALHLASAEKGKADIFLTTDDRLIRLADRVKGKLDVRVANPLEWLREGFSNED